MVLVITKNTVKDRDAYLPLAKAFTSDASHDRGCLMMDVCVDPATVDEVVFVSKWEAKEDFQAHVQGESFQKHMPRKTMKKRLMKKPRSNTFRKKAIGASALT